MKQNKVSTKDVIEQYHKYVIGNYGRLPVVLVRGQGSYVWDAEGKRYLDMFPGWAVSGLGHCPGPVVEAIQAGAKDFIVKPFQPPRVLESLQKLLG